MPTELPKYTIIAPAARFFAEPDMKGPVETDVLFGETVEVLGEHGPFYKVSFPLYASPGYVFKGDARRAELHRRSVSPKHRVIVPRANIYTNPSFKFPDPNGLALPMNALVRIIDRQPSPEGYMAYVDGLGWLFADQIVSTDNFHKDYVEVACRYVGSMASYTWGGRMFPDCSGLVQQALIACGIACPRNTGEQMTMLGKEIGTDEHDFSYRRGDLVFFHDPSANVRHVVIMVDDSRCVHASIMSATRAVAIEPLSAVIAQQFKGSRNAPTMIRRFPNR